MNYVRIECNESGSIHEVAWAMDVSEYRIRIEKKGG
jgi:hypothetical protein